MNYSIPITRYCSLMLAAVFVVTTHNLKTSSARALSTVATAGKDISFTSCASPRFDTFSERLVGDWQWTNGENQQIETASVKEVMRSCGGAVQGIRELPHISPTTRKKENVDVEEEDEGYYLNRANDGFIFFDQDGSYSCGPIKINDESDDEWLSSLSFGKCRLILASASSSSAESQQSCQSYHVIRKSFSSSSDTIIPDSNSIKLLEDIPQDIIWTEMIRCRMSSANQPWMMQRLKWEKYSCEDDIQPFDNSVLGTSHICTWNIQEGMDDMNNVSVGGICSKSGLVKSILREYSNPGRSLGSVTWLQGQLREPGGDEDI